MLKLFLFLELLHHFGIAVANQGLDEIIFQRAIKVYLIPVFLIPMPCAAPQKVDTERWKTDGK